MSPTTPVPNEESPPSLNDRTRANIKLVKVIRGVSDEDIAKLGFTSRQVVADRVSGRTELTLSDVDRFAAALGVSRDALLASRAECVAWLDQHEKTPQLEQPAKVAPMKGRTSPKKAAAKSAAAKRPSARRRQA